MLYLYLYVKHMDILLYPLVTMLGVMVSSPFLKAVCLEVDCLKSNVRDPFLQLELPTAIHTTGVFISLTS